MFQVESALGVAPEAGLFAAASGARRPADERGSNPPRRDSGLALGFAPAHDA
jgi:hypothetical protein